jgi:hypothetical protein
MLADRMQLVKCLFETPELDNEAKLEGHSLQVGVAPRHNRGSHSDLWGHKKC